MTPGARVAAPIDLLGEIVGRALRGERGRPADLVANAFFRARRFIGGGDRRAVGDRVWGILRRYGPPAWGLDPTRHPDPSPRALLPAAPILVAGPELRPLAPAFHGGPH